MFEQSVWNNHEYCFENPALTTVLQTAYSKKVWNPNTLHFVLPVSAPLTAPMSVLRLTVSGLKRKMKGVPCEFVAEGPALSGCSAHPSPTPPPRRPEGPGCRRRCRWGGRWRSQLWPLWHRRQSGPTGGYLDRSKKGHHVFGEGMSGNKKKNPSHL